MHQPLHGIQRFSSATPDGDAGGNLVKVCDGGTACNKRLHGTWDGAAGGNSSVSLPCARPSGSRTRTRRASISPIPANRSESAEIAKNYVYSAPIGQGAGPYTLTPAYKDKAREIAEERIALAGARLAKLLNEFLK